MLQPGGFTINGQRVSVDTLKVGTTTGAGTSTTIVDANALTDAAANYWKNAVVYVLTGAAKGQTAVVTGSVVGTLTIAPALPAAPGVGAQYLLVADPTGEVYNLVQQVLNAVQQLGSIVIIQSGTTPIDKGGGVQYVGVSLVDRSSSPPAKVPSANIDITAATMLLYKSTADGSFSTAGITPQPTLVKSLGLVESQDGAGNKGFAITTGQWAAGDTGLIILTGVKVTDSNGNVEPLGDIPWTFQVEDTLNVDTNVTAIKTAIGTNADAPGTGTVFARLAQIVTTYLADATIGLSAIKTDVDNVYARVGAPAGASIAADIAEIEGETDTIIATLGTPAGASMSADIAAIRAEQDADETAILARIGTPAGASIAADIAEIEGETDQILANLTLGDTAATPIVTAASGTAETSLITDTTSKGMTRYVVDLSNLTQVGSLAFYEQIDGVNERMVQQWQNINPAVNPKGWDNMRLVDAPTARVRIGWTPSVAEGADRSVPTRTIKDVRS